MKQIIAWIERLTERKRKRVSILIPNPAECEPFWQRTHPPGVVGPDTIRPEMDESVPLLGTALSLKKGQVSVKT